MLTFAVHDDGAGFEPAAVAGGHGFVNMEDRLGAFEGVLTVTSAPGEGTTVEGRVPAEPLADASRGQAAGNACAFVRIALGWLFALSDRRGADPDLVGDS